MGVRMMLRQLQSARMPLSHVMMMMEEEGGGNRYQDMQHVFHDVQEAIATTSCSSQWAAKLTLKLSSTTWLQS